MRRDPRVLGIRITEPFDEILKLPVATAVVQDLFDLVLRCSRFCDNRWRLFRDTWIVWLTVVRSEETRMECVVDTTI